MPVLGQYISGSSGLHLLDARIKILSVVLLSLLILQGGAWQLAAITGVYWILIQTSHVGFHRIWQMIRPLLVLFALLFGVHLLFTDGGTPLSPFPDWPVTITREGLIRGSMTVWQFLLLVLGGGLLAMTTAPSDLVGALERLLRPLKALRVPTHDLAVMTGLCIRFVPVILEEIQRVKEAQKCRGARLDHGPLLHRIKALATLALPVILSIFRRADELTMAMEARGYRRGPRTWLKEPCMTRRDYQALVLVLVLWGGLFAAPVLLGPFMRSF